MHWAIIQRCTLTFFFLLQNRSNPKLTINSLGVRSSSIGIRNILLLYEVVLTTDKIV